MLIGVTKFFRDRESFRILRHKVIPEIFSNAEKREYKSVRVWTPGCSTGEEAYSIAMLLQDYMDSNRTYIDVKVFATDIDREAIEFAGIGLYPESIVAELNMEFISRYFEKKAKGYQVRRNVREMVVFAIQNLIKDPPFTKVDLISCRNLLIYLQPVLQKKVFSTFNYALVPGGYLFLGSSESIGDAADNFEPFDLKNRIYSHPNKGTIPVKGDAIYSSPPQIPALSSAYKMYSQPNKTEYTQKYESQENYYHALIRCLASSVIVINEKWELIQSFGNARKYLKVPEGNMTLDILMMFPRELSLAVSSAVHKVRKTGKPVEYNDIKLKENEVVSSIHLKAGVISETRGYARIFVLHMEESNTGASDSGKTINLSSPGEDFTIQRINDLEQEIQFTRENLQATIEELQTSNEELQATNEELLAANEELQSTNEELQSVNEELNTVNAEYQSKNIELTELNYDMKNLMESTNIGTIFLDKDICIRKFTPAVNRIVNLLEQDIGRPLRDLYIPLFGDDILKDAEKVLADSESIEKRLCSQTETFLIRIMPFIDDKKIPEGVVITILDITAQALAEKELQLKSDLLENILEQSPSAQLVVDKKGKILFANMQTECILNFTKQSLLSMNLYSQELNLKNLDEIPITEENSPVTDIINSGKAVKNFVICQHRKQGEEMIFSVSGNYVSSIKDDIIILKLETLAHRGWKQGSQNKENR